MCIVHATRPPSNCHKMDSINNSLDYYGISAIVVTISSVIEKVLERIHNYYLSLLHIVGSSISSQNH